MKCHLLLGDWLSGRADMAPDISECTCGFWSFAVVEMCESGGPNPPSHFQFEVLHKIVYLQVFRVWFLYLDAEWFAVDIVLVCCWWLVKGVARPPMLCVAQNHRLQAHRHCCLTWIFCVKWNMRDFSEKITLKIAISICLCVFVTCNSSQVLVSFSCITSKLRQGQTWIPRQMPNAYDVINSDKHSELYKIW